MQRIRHFGEDALYKSTFYIIHCIAPAAAAAAAAAATRCQQSHSTPLARAVTPTTVHTVAVSRPLFAEAAAAGRCMLPMLVIKPSGAVQV